MDVKPNDIETPLLSRPRKSTDGVVCGGPPSDDDETPPTRIAPHRKRKAKRPIGNALWLFIHVATYCSPFLGLSFVVHSLQVKNARLETRIFKLEQHEDVFHDRIAILETLQDSFHFQSIHDPIDVGTIHLDVSLVRAEE